VSRIGFYAGLPFHEPILAPIRDAVTEHTTMLSADRRELATFDPTVLVMADAADLEWFRVHLPRAWLGSVRHGMIGKLGIARLPARDRARRFDFIAVGDRLSPLRYARAGAQPGAFWLTGYPQLDPLFRREAPPDFGLDRSRPTVLYAPTWNLGFSSAPMLGARLVDLVRGTASRRDSPNLIIKPHPMIALRRPSWLKAWADMERRYERVRLIAEPDADVTAAMLTADVLISDASSVIFEFLALDRPIILLTNPRHRFDPAYDPEDIVWRWRDVGDERTDVEQLPEAVAWALADPGRNARRRGVYAEELFGAFRDGLNHARVAGLLTELASSGPRPADEASAALSIWPRFAAFRRQFRVDLGRNRLVSSTVLARLESGRLQRRENGREAVAATLISIGD
jgi:hypothetical protein